MDIAFPTLSKVADLSGSKQWECNFAAVEDAAKDFCLTVNTQNSSLRLKKATNTTTRYRQPPG